MEENMRITLDNVGIVKQSSIDVCGLTVITGANNSGKSTVGKALFSLVHAVENYEFHALVDKRNYALAQVREIPSFFPMSVKSAIKSKCKSDSSFIKAVFVDQKILKSIEPEDTLTFLDGLYADIQNLSFEILDVKESYLFNFLESSDYSSENFESDKQKALDLIDNVCSRLNEDPELENYVKEAVRTQLNVEFAEQIAPAKFPESLVSIDICDGNRTCFHLEMQEGNIVENPKKLFEQNPYSSVYYIDDPFVVEEEAQFSRMSLSHQSSSFFDSNLILPHRDDLKFQLSHLQRSNIWEKVQIGEQFRRICEKMDVILPGTFVSEGNSEFFKGIDGSKLNIKNLATGSKMFSILKMLIEAGFLTGRTLLILDEPECHLHPDWQNKFAEIVVLLVKEIGCHVLLTTHSQNFMLALDTMTRKYEIKDRTKFYQALKGDDSFVRYNDVSHDLKPIYADFVKSFSQMKLLYDEIANT